MSMHDQETFTIFELMKHIKTNMFKHEEQDNSWLYVYNYYKRFYNISWKGK